MNGSARRQSKCRNATRLFLWRSISGERLLGNAVLRTLLCQKEAKFKLASVRATKSGVNFFGTRMYLDSFTKCFSIRGKNGSVRFLYSLDSSMSAHSIALLECSVAEVAKGTSFRPQVFHLSKSNRLYVLDADSGRIVDSVFLSTVDKFRQVDWETEQERLVVTATHRAGRRRNMYKLLAIFKVAPLRLVGVLKLDSTVFGDTFLDAMVAWGILFTDHSDGRVRAYDLNAILEQCSGGAVALGQCFPGTSDVVGSHPFGLPVTVHLNSAPPLLWQTSGRLTGLAIGGSPWLCVASPSSKVNSIVTDVRTGNLVENGELKSDCLSELDEAYFHPDGGSSLFHVTGSQIRPSSIDQSIWPFPCHLFILFFDVSSSFPLPSLSSIPLPSLVPFLCHLFIFSLTISSFAISSSFYLAISSSFPLPSLHPFPCHLFILSTAISSSFPLPSLHPLPCHLFFLSLAISSSFSLPSLLPFPCQLFTLSFTISLPSLHPFLCHLFFLSLAICSSFPLPTCLPPSAHHL